jgi:hypothetical protein
MTRDELALHEAAHAIIGTALGFSVESVTIHGTDTYEGMAAIGLPRQVEQYSEEYEMWHRAWAFAIIAGEVAVSISTRLLVDWESMEDIRGSDFYTLVDLAQYFGSGLGDVGPGLERMERGARLLVYRHRERIGALTQALLTHTTLDANAVAASAQGLGRLGARQRRRGEEQAARAWFEATAD